MAVQHTLRRVGTGSNLRRALRSRNAMVGGAIVAVMVFLAIFGPWLAPMDFQQTNLLSSWAAPSDAHLLGADRLGRDVLSRLLVGARVSLIIALTVVALALAIGVLIGMLAGYLGGRVDSWLMRTVDFGLAFPEVVIAIVVASIIGPGLETVIVALTFAWWPGTARLGRSLVLMVRREMYIDSAIVSGVRVPVIFWRHLLPSIAPALIVRASVGIGYVIMGEATLSFLGLGVQEPMPSWGGMIRDGLPVLRTDPHLAVFASATLALAVIGFNMLGDGLRDLLDPKLKAAA